MTTPSERAALPMDRAETIRHRWSLDDGLRDEIAAAIEASVEDERDACAKLADRMRAAAAGVLQERHDDDAAAQHDTAMEIAEAIRQRGGDRP